MSACLLFHVGCTVDADIAAATFGHDAALRDPLFVRIGRQVWGERLSRAKATLEAAPS